MDDPDNCEDLQDIMDGFGQSIILKLITQLIIGCFKI